MARRPFFILIPIGFFLAIGLAVMFLWNTLVPAIIGLPMINYWQALGLFVLCRLLFGGFGFGGGRTPPFARHKFREKWMNMTDEERAQLKEQWRKRCND